MGWDGMGWDGMGWDGDGDGDDWHLHAFDSRGCPIYFILFYFILLYIYIPIRDWMILFGAASYVL